MKKRIKLSEKKRIKLSEKKARYFKIQKGREVERYLPTYILLCIFDVFATMRNHCLTNDRGEFRRPVTIYK